MIISLLRGDAVHNFVPDKSENIDELLVALVSGDVLTAQQSMVLEAWKAASVDNRVRLEQMRATWNLLGQRSLALPEFRAIDVMARPPRRSASVIGRIGDWRRPAWVAAGLAAALLVFAINRSTRPTERESVQHYAAVDGQASDIRLDDGTVVHMAPGSTLDVTHGSGGRDVRLTGQAFFAVTHQAGRPFRVHTSSGDIKVLGTRFNVNSDHARTDLVVVDGRVELSTGAHRVQVVGGEISRAEHGDVAPAVAVPDVYSRLGWMSSTMLFNATPLPRVADEIAHRFGVRVQVDSSLDEHTVTAVFNNRPLPDVLDVVCRIIDAKCSIASDSEIVRISAHTAPM